jgi:hypothetical protein
MCQFSPSSQSCSLEQVFPGGTRRATQLYATHIHMNVDNNPSSNTVALRIHLSWLGAQGNHLPLNPVVDPAVRHLLDSAHGPNRILTAYSVRITAGHID